MLNSNTQVEKIVVAFSVLAILSGFSVLATGFMFPTMRKRLFMRLIMLIAISDTIGSVASAFGFPANHTALCAAQTFLINFFYQSG